jgi:hypothetical protein
MINEVELIVRKGNDAVTYTQGIDGVDVSQEKIYISFNSPNWNCSESQLMLDTIQAQGGLNIKVYDNLDVYLGDAFLTTASFISAQCENNEDATLRYDASQSTLDIDKCYYFTWELGGSIEYRLDLYENESISQNWNFTDISEFATIGSYSREFRIPLTELNQQVLGAVSDVNYMSEGVSDTLFSTKILAEIRVNTLPIIKGHLRVMRTFKQRDRLTDVQLTFYSETPDLIRNIGDKKLRDLTNIGTLDHVCDYSSVTATGGDYMYSLIDRGQKWDETGTDGTRRILNPSNPVWPADLTPSVKWRWIFEQVMSDASFTYDADDLLAVLDNYYMPFITRPRLNDPTKYVFSAQITANQSIASGGYLTGTTESVDNDNVYASDTFTAPLDCTYYFDFWTTMFVASPVNNGRIVEVYLSDITDNVDYLAGSITNGSTGWQYIEGHTPAFFTLIGGHDYRVKYRIYNLAMLEIPVAQTFVYSTQPYGGCGWRLIQVGDTTTNVPVTMLELAPDVKQVDFLRDVIKMHNLVLIPDRSRDNHVIIQSMVNYLGSGGTEDWTSKLDISKDITIESTTDLQRQNLTFTYSVGGDVASKFFQDVGGRIYGDYKINGYQVSASTPTNEFATGELSAKLTTQSTPAQEIVGTDIALPKFINDKGEFVAPFMRCLYHGGDADIQLTDGTTSTLTSVPLLNHYSTINASINDYDLNFAPETPLHDITSNPYNNLFNLYWREYLNGIYSPEARLMTASFALELTDVLTFSFANQYWIKDAYWRILEINDYKVGNVDSTQVKLLKVINPVNDCNLIPVSSLPNGVVQWEDSSGDPASGTSLCCSRYGWYWSNARNECFSVLRQGGDIQTTSNDIISNNLGQVRAPSNSLRSAVNLDADLSSQFSAYVGSSITIDSDNAGTLAVGRSLTLEGQNRGAALLGKNVIAKSAGLHIGGGWMSDSSSAMDGSQQSGMLICANKDVIASSGDQLEMPIESIPNNRINLPDGTGWSCLITANIRTNTDFGYYIWSVYLDKDGAGVATASVPQLVMSDSGIAQTIDLIVDTASVTSEHRLLLEFTGTGFPIQFYAMMTIQYSQIRI